MAYTNYNNQHQVQQHIEQQPQQLYPVHATEQHHVLEAKHQTLTIINYTNPDNADQPHPETIRGGVVYEVDMNSSQYDSSKYDRMDSSQDDTVTYSQSSENTHTNSNTANRMDTSTDVQTENDVSDPGEAGNNTSSMTPIMKTPNSYKYPLLKKYFEFGPWVGRNRKALCLHCRVQSASSQPDRLIKHLNRCPAISDDDRVVVQDLMNERTAHKRKKPTPKSQNANSEGSDFFNSEQEDVPLDRKSRIDRSLTRWIIADKVSLRVIESKSFVDFVHAMDPTYQIPTRETITNKLIPSLLNII